MNIAMKRLFKTLTLLVSLLACTQAFAQYVPTWSKGDLEKKGGSIAVNGQSLDKAAVLALLNQAGGSQLADEWSAAASKRGLGVGLTAGGFGVAAVGSAVAVVSAVSAGFLGGIGKTVGGEEVGETGYKSGTPLVIGGLVAAAAGIVTGIIGTTKLSSANSAMEDIVNRCNQAGPAHAATVTVGSTPSGVGLALRF